MLRNSLFNTNILRFIRKPIQGRLCDKTHEQVQQLCDAWSGNGALQCYPNKTGCPGATNNNCNPNVVWSETESGSNHYYGNLNSGTFNYTNNNPVTLAYGVRCVPGFGKLMMLGKYAQPTT